MIGSPRLHHGAFRQDSAALGWTLLCVSISVGLLWAVGGCSRGFYRRQADMESYALIDRAACATGSSPGSYGIEPDSTSRMYDPDCADRPAMPPDDPVAHQLMHCVDCKPGWPCWHRNGETPWVENPAWRAYLPQDDQGRVVLDRAGAMRLALLHSPEYQQQLEDLYLSALTVTLERFRFDTQFFGDNATFFTTDGPARVTGSSSQLNTDTNLQMRKFFATGGDLVVGMANSLVWQFAGPDTYSANTLLDFSLVQPLLRAGGRDVVLESLTETERDLLASIRSVERFRRTFYTQITAAYLRVLEQQVEIRNQRTNVAGLRDSLDRLEALHEVGQMASFNVNLTRQNLYRSQSQLLRLNKSYQDSLDAFKLLLGLPPDLDLKIEDPLVARFELIDPSLTAMHETVSEFAEQLRDPAWTGADHPDNVRLLAALRKEVLAALEMVDGDFERLLGALPMRTKQLGQLAERPDLRRGDVDPKIADFRELYRRVVTLSDWMDGIEASKEMARQLGLALEEEDKNDEPDAPGGDPMKFAGVAESVNSLLDTIDSIGAGAPLPDDDEDQDGKADVETRQGWLGDQLTELSTRLLQLSLIQAGARLEVIMLTAVKMDPGEAFE
ncbi:MAG: TolC family protein, partial [Candidatus Nealsonbacteria bacterium]|nr:TolC family protein [Candidatus Nealsonbacteria bacterium]